jgi:hypothetical protein
MLRIPLMRVLNPVSSARCLTQASRTNSTQAPAAAPEKVEVFIDDKSVLVDPGTTVLQVRFCFDHTSVSGF